jgi:hypothetical protein
VRAQIPESTEDREDDVLVLERDPRRHADAWPEVQRRVVAELSQAGHRVSTVPSDSTTPSDELLAEVAARGALAGVLVHAHGAQTRGCMAIAEVLMCREFDTRDDAALALLLVEWLHENLLRRGLWTRPSFTEDVPSQSRPTLEPRRMWRAELLGGAYVSFDRGQLWGLATLRFAFAPIDMLAIALEAQGSVVPLSLADMRGRALVGFAAVHLRVFWDLVDPEDIELGPILALGAWIAAGHADANAPYVGRRDAVVSVHGDVGARVGFAFAVGWFAIAEATVAFSAPAIEVRFADEAVASLGGAAFSGQAGMAAQW